VSSADGYQASGFRACAFSELAESLEAFDDSDRVGLLAKDLGMLSRDANARAHSDRATPFAEAFNLARGPGIDVRYPLFRTVTQAIAEQAGFEFHGTHQGNNVLTPLKLISQTNRD
jgi:hypothetical protein